MSDDATLAAPEGFSDPLLNSNESEEKTHVEMKIFYGVVNRPLPISEARPEARPAARPNERIVPPKDTYPQHPVAGEFFNIEHLDNQVFLTHPSWSLTGAGSNLLGAEEDLKERARMVADIYLSASPSEMTEQAQRLREFILNVL